MKKLITIFSIIIFFSSHINAQDFMMQGWYWEYPKTCDGNFWAVNLNIKSTELANAGFTDLWLPPLSRSAFGSCSNGYDVKDYYDLGAFGQGPTGFGTRTQVDILVNVLSSKGINAVADMVYNHRDGGTPENNQAVKDYITIHYDANKNPYPSDRFRCRLPLGGSSGNDAGNYYFKISSKSQSSNFHNKPYNVYMRTSQVWTQGLPDQTETEPNGGGDCNEPYNDILLGVTMNATIEGVNCTADEFKLCLDSSDYNLNGDFLEVYLINPNKDYTDHRIYGLWSGNQSDDIVDQIEYQTNTNFTNLPSAQGAMNFENFKPNSNNTSYTFLGGDWDYLWFNYDVDQNNANSQTILYDWTKWMWDDVGIRGFRLDAVKHFDPAFVGDLLDEMHDLNYDPKIVVGELYDFNPAVLKSWVDNVNGSMDQDTKDAIKPRVFDFALRGSLKEACDGFGFDVRNIFESGIVDGAGGNPENAVTFINNHDFRDAGQTVFNDPILVYAYILTNNQIGIPCVFYSDFFEVPVINYPITAMKDELINLMDIQKNYIFGAYNKTYLSELGTSFSSNYTSGAANNSLIYQLSNSNSGREVIVAINFSGSDLIVNHNINTSSITNGANMVDLTGNSYNGNTVVNNNAIDISIPARSYAVYVEGSNCIADLNLDQTIVPDPYYQVEYTINATGSIVQDTDFNAGDLIQLNNGFNAPENYNFIAEIDGCNF